MKSGDVIRDCYGKYWVIYDADLANLYVCVTDTKTQTQNEIIELSNIIEVFPRPGNIEWLFLTRREKNLEDLFGLV